VNTPWRSSGFPAQYWAMNMKRKNQSPLKKSAGTRHPNTPTASTKETKNAVSASRDEVAESAYFIYLNQGSTPGNEVHHWLQAEAEVMEGHRAGQSVT